MKNERLLDKLNLLDDKYINEVKLGSKKRKTLNWLIRFGALAACICLMITGLNLFLFIPFKTSVPDVSQYKNSEYFPIIEKINSLSAKEPKYKNNFDKITSTLASIGGVLDKDGVGGDVSNNTSFDTDFAPGDGSYDEEYNEITDNQVSGVTEGDIIKRSDKYIYYLSGGVLRAYSILGDDSEMVGELYLSHVETKNEYGKEELIDLGTNNSEMYLSKDCKTITIIGDTINTKVISLDVSNPASITLKNYVSIEGRYQTSRIVDGKLLVVTSKYYNNIDFSKEETFVPSVSYDNETQTMLVPMDKIACADKITNKHHTVVSLLDENTLDLSGCASFFSFTNDVYITNNAIYASSTYYENFKDISLRHRSVTEISCISYGDEGFSVKGTVRVDGYLKDRYSFDEYEGILRVVTTTRVSTVQHNAFYDEKYSKPIEPNGTSASLYCIDIDKWEIVASVEKFAPLGETVRSVRFDKNYAYVCTAVELTDPVFFFDLSDLTNITYKETGNIEGFSTSLINLGNGYLLGIGRGDDWSTVKVEVYREGEDKVESVCSYVIEHASYDTNYKSYYINRDECMFGFGYDGYKTNNRYEGCHYVLLKFVNSELLALVNTPIDASPNIMRSVYIDGYLYIFGSNDFKVFKI